MKNKQPKKHPLDPSKIHLTDFRILEGALYSPMSFKIEDIKSYSFDIGFDMAFNLSDSVIKAEFKVKIKTISKETNEDEATGMFHFVYIYIVDNLEEMAQLDDEDDTIDVNDGLANAISSITYSTSRGILMSRFKGTALENFILPVISPNDLLEMPLNSIED